MNQFIENQDSLLDYETWVEIGLREGWISLATLTTPLPYGTVVSTYTRRIPADHDDLPF